MNTVVYLALVLAVVGCALGVASRLARAEGRLARVERKLDLIMEHLDLREDVARMDEVTALVREGKKIHAIKVYRETTGAGLKEAKEAVDRLG
ncbi:Ribosomal protein L7/L12 C-terminal domain-containing protein [Streptomyces sp. 1222.5]|uniref:ribosomal protein L7/L12 n=1 Tax=unclassified Streptomyces TaxID=2593676 RepID=UPI000895B4BC|nr:MULTISPECIES: ribosomal protein L7/L12 [unclassified Streptomyces]PKW11120.1 ribosomal L7/L12-like protein [Streptomyces sp. 5112.2]SEB87588.1 Ribosomal protein L7/L12 C-terminal domain-containing protein [Streptomyces sp. 1222.5]